MKKGLSVLLIAALLLCMMAGCGTPAASSETDSTPVSDGAEMSAAPSEPATEVPDASMAEPEDSSEETSLTGAVIPAEDCKAKGYDVKYGMFDFETYVELPLTEEPRTLSYWFMIQPFMMGYNNVTENDFTYFKEMEARTGVHLDLKAVSMFSSAEQFALMLTSGDYTDMVEGATANYSGGGSKAIP